MTGTDELNLLVVDDEPDLAKGLRRILKTHGHRVRTAASGEDAIRLTEEEQPDGILMDVKMPGMNGVEAFRVIRSLSPETFVIFMSGYSDVLDEAQEEGAVAVLSKPLDVEKVCHLIDQGRDTRPVLIVDDDEDLARSLARVIEFEGHSVLIATNPEEAVPLFEKNPRAVVVLDMKLNGLTGLELLVLLQAKNERARVIGMTGYPEMYGLIEKGLGSLKTRSFTKPFDPKEIVKALEEIMSCAPTRDIGGDPEQEQE